MVLSECLFLASPVLDILMSKIGFIMASADQNITLPRTKSDITLLGLTANGFRLCL